ncbi:hypothetical protein Fmac_028278 [Flemingia macrophylla]|uniref:Protein kinase domain-containing protein n=1 Tax=Flemingia macrophylla TaxID=520843 RepID=A0ABD1L721_9FABA
MGKMVFQRPIEGINVFQNVKARTKEDQRFHAKVCVLISVTFDCGVDWRRKFHYVFRPYGLRSPSRGLKRKPSNCAVTMLILMVPLYIEVAVKRLKRKFCFWEEYTNLREVKVLRKMNHPNIIKLKEDCNLYHIIKEREKPFSEEEIRCFMKQVLQGLSHMHKKGFFHRDLKPENLLVTNDVLKIADFGLAREVSSMPPYTQYVSTRWYRAPEVLLRCPCYTPAVDMWAVGAILAELFTLTPLFPGESEIDQLYKIYHILGMPDSTSFTIGADNSQLLDLVAREVESVNVPHVQLSNIIPNASLEAIDLITQLLHWDPSRRPDADQSLQHPFFHVDAWVPCPLSDPLELKLSGKRAKPNLELKLQDFGPDPDDCFLGLTLAVKPSISNLDVVQSVSQGVRENMLLCSDFNDHSEESGKHMLFAFSHPIHRMGKSPAH